MAEEEEEWVDYDGGAVRERHRSASHILVASGVEVIPESAFSRVTNLREIDLGNVTTISDHAFYDCRSLERVVWTTASAVEIGGYAFANCYNLREIDFRNATKIGKAAFGYCVALKRVAISSSVAAIEMATFEGCYKLTEVELGEGMQRIGKRAFRDCTSLEQIILPASVTVIEDEAFWNCSSSPQVELNEGLQRIGASAFAGCNSLLRISIPSTTLKVGRDAFADCQQLRHAELQEGIRTIEPWAFWGCKSLERVTIPSSVTSIGGCAFQSCRSLSEVTLREGVHLIDSCAFDDCTSLERITIPPVALVINIERSRCRLSKKASMHVPRRRRKLIVSNWLQYRSPYQLAQAQTKVNEILGRDVAGWEKIACIRDWSVYCDLLDVTTMLELAVWRCNNGDDSGTNAEARQASRRDCGSDMNIIIPGVLQFLDSTQQSIGEQPTADWEPQELELGGMMENATDSGRRPRLRYIIIFSDEDSPAPASPSWPPELELGDMMENASTGSGASPSRRSSLGSEVDES